MNWNKVNELISGATRILLTSHENPDGDGLGSSSALYYHLLEEGKECKIINYSDFPAEYYYLNKDQIFETYHSNKHDKWLKNCDLAIIFDVGDFNRLRKIKDIIEKFGIKTLNIDHHPHPTNHPFTINIVDTNAAATGSMIYEYFQQFRQRPITKKIGEGIYTAVMTDTGSFRYSNTNEACHEIAIACLAAGVDTSKIYQNVYESKPQSSVRLLARVIDNVRFENDGIFAWFTIDKSMLDSVGATSADVDGFTDFVRTIKGVEVSMMIFENGADTCRLNFRSKGTYAVNDVAIAMGGGGHKFAAGAIVRGKKETVIPQVVGAVKASLRRQSA
ncbi:MAG: bifunctional oligoribonuclease/PAP phosphatase NrnA [Fidelibacterota bacterium]